MNTDLLQIPEIQQAGLLSYKKICAGTINQTFLVNTKQDKWIVRLNNTAIAGINRKHEALILDLIKPLNISPKIIANNLQREYLITKYIAQSNWSQQDCINQQQLLINQLTKIHQIDLPTKLPKFSHRLEQYQQDARHLLGNDFKIKHQKTIQKLEVLGFFNTHKLIHFDLNHHNLLGTNPLTIIDWEFAGSGHPIFDCAIFIHNQQLNLRQSKTIVCYCRNFLNGEAILKLSMDLVKQMFSMWAKIGLSKALVSI
ncbi:hypothetical protein MNBD_GAMMA01-962 [hydrothermal vent metagenome]|uniref:Aminoglycoside phosphotransferase domain-containing protein n=1 Tax=hydrothermal vent metagenome TaxID=652676 RepID=A0A3B0V9L6_9ZZZZ